MKSIFLSVFFFALLCGTHLQAQTKTIPCDSNVFVPNVFTPNGDGTNDVFIPVFGKFIPVEYSFVIYNRWGQIMFESTDPKKGWVPDKETQDMYIWKLKYRYTKEGELYECTGQMALIR